MGNLVKVWAKLPEDIKDNDLLITLFEEHFGQKWNDVMIDAQSAMPHHTAWNAFFAVSDITSIPPIRLSCFKEEHTKIPLEMRFLRKPTLVLDPAADKSANMYDLNFHIALNKKKEPS